MSDQGYLREPHVVWERLSGIDGDTAFYQARAASTPVATLMRPRMQKAQVKPYAVHCIRQAVTTTHRQELSRREQIGMML